MANLEPLGIKRIQSLHYFVHDLDRSRRFYIDKMDFAEVAASTPETEAETGERAAAFQAGDSVVICRQPVRDDSPAGRWLARHPDGVGRLVFDVEDAEKAFRLLDSRGGTPTSDLRRLSDGQGGTCATFDITTPFGSSRFRFEERRGYAPYAEGLVTHDTPKGGENRFGFGEVDHITSNFETMSPALLWMEHVLGFERYWDVAFHTNDVVAPGAKSGSGLRSIVMWDPHSGVKFANNEPLRPFFEQSQIYVFVEDERGDGIQHAALAVRDIIPAVRGLRERDVKFMPTPGTYYDALPDRLKTSGILRIDEDQAILRDLEILIDGKEEHSYLLQIFLRESAGTHGDPKAGPFFFEVIQRKGDKGFGEGNFRALFESIERQQQAEGRV